MSRQSSRIVWTVGVTGVLAVAGSTGWSLALARQDDAPRIPLPAQDRGQIEKYLERRVVRSIIPNADRRSNVRAVHRRAEVLVQHGRPVRTGGVRALVGMCSHWSGAVQLAPPEV